MSPQPVLIITGASRGIGRAAAWHALTECNACVVAIARNAQLLDTLHAEAAAQGKQESLIVVADDVTDDATVQTAVDSAIARWGRIDGVVANAGLLEPVATVHDADLDQWKRLFDVNFFSILCLAQKALPHLSKAKGAIVMVSSGAATLSVRGWGAYGSSKAAVNHLASTLSVEEPDVTTIALRPGVVDTDMQKTSRSTGKGGAIDEAMRKEFTTLHEQGMLIPPELTGKIISRLALDPPRSLSGSFVNWNDDVLQRYQQ